MTTHRNRTVDGCRVVQGRRYLSATGARARVATNRLTLQTLHDHQRPSMRRALPPPWHARGTAPPATMISGPRQPAAATGTCRLAPVWWAACVGFERFPGLSLHARARAPRKPFTPYTPTDSHRHDGPARARWFTEGHRPEPAVRPPHETTSVPDKRSPVEWRIAGTTDPEPGQIVALRRPQRAARAPPRPPVPTAQDGPGASPASTAPRPRPRPHGADRSNPHHVTPPTRPAGGRPVRCPPGSGVPDIHR